MVDNRYQINTGKMKGSRDILLWVVLWLTLIRFWIEVITTTLLKNSQIINSINNNKIGFHHYQLGTFIILISVIMGRFLPKFKFQANLALGFGIALCLDQYTYILLLAGIHLPFGYRSAIDYSIMGVIMVGLFLYWSYLGKIEEK